MGDSEQVKRTQGTRIDGVQGVRKNAPILVSRANGGEYTMFHGVLTVPGG